MSCIATAIDHFMSYHTINPMYHDYISAFLQDSNYTIYTRLNPLYLDRKLAVQFIDTIQDIQPHSIIGLYIRPKHYLNVYGYHYFYVDKDSIVSSWYTKRNITEEEYNALEYRPRSLSETSIENGNIEPTVFSLYVIELLWQLIHNDIDDIGNDLYRLFGGTDLANLTLKKSEYDILLYMYTMDT
jgi:hypothetical protein